MREYWQEMVKFSGTVRSTFSSTEKTYFKMMSKHCPTAKKDAVVKDTPEKKNDHTP